jgi:hypothetical protein
MKVLQIEEPYKQQFFEAIVCKDWHFVLPEDDTTVPKHVRDIPLTFVLIKIVHLVGVIIGVL